MRTDNDILQELDGILRQNPSKMDASYMTDREAFHVASQLQLEVLLDIRSHLDRLCYETIRQNHNL